MSAPLATTARERVPNRRPSLSSTEIRWRKRLLRHRDRLCEAWDQTFPQHDFATGRLREQQQIIADPGWTEAAREYHAVRGERLAVVEIEPERLALLRRLLNDDVSIERAWSEINDPRSRPTPQSTVEAVLHCVRERGVAALKEPTNIERLRRCDAAALAQVNQRIARLKGEDHA